jgi:hypothetical protein
LAKTSAKNFKCEICDYSTQNQARLKQHTNLVHLNMKNFKCTQCSSKFGTNLLDQEQRHSTAALVCKRFLHLTRRPQLLKCVYYRGFFSDFEAIFRANKFDSLLEMLRDNKQIRKLTLEKRCNVLEILKVVAPHDSLRLLDLKMNLQKNIRKNQLPEWQKIFSQVSSKLTSFENLGPEWFNCFAPLVNAKYLTTLRLGESRSRSRVMANKYTCLKNVEFVEIDDCSNNSELAHFLEKHSGTVTTLVLATMDKDPLPAITKCKNLKKFHLQDDAARLEDMKLNSLGRLSNLRYLFLEGLTNSNLGHIIETAKFQHLNEIKFKFIGNLSDNDISQIARTYGHQV